VSVDSIFTAVKIGLNWKRIEMVSCRAGFICAGGIVRVQTASDLNLQVKKSCWIHRNFEIKRKSRCISYLVCCAEKRTESTTTSDGLACSRRRAILYSICAAGVLAGSKPVLANVGGKERCDALNGIECGSGGVSSKNLVVYEAPSIKSEVTGKVFLKISAIGKEIGTIEIELFGKDAPKSAVLFQQLCSGTYQDGLSYEGSQVFRVVKDRAIYLGRLAKGAAVRTETYIDNIGHVRSIRVSAADRAYNADQNSIPVDRAGVLLMKKGGGSFEFLIKSAPGLDKGLEEDYLVVGQVASGMDTVARLNALAVNQPTAYKNSFLSAGKLINDKRATAAEDDVFKPLQKTVVVRSGIQKS